MRYQQYRFKFYLNARHAIYTDGVLGDMHPHTWEITLHVVKSKEQVILFKEMQDLMEDFFATYQERVLNDVPPFDVINPTLENCAQYFREKIQGILNQHDWILLVMEMSESPSFTYVISMIDEQEVGSNQMLNALTDDLIEEILNANIEE